MSIPKVVILDRDGVLTFGSSDPASPFYYLLDLDHVILKPGVVDACRIIAAHKVPVIMTTKQRCVSKGLVSRDMVNIINARVARLVDLPMDILVEEEAENKRSLYESILRHHYKVNPQDMHLFDDSEGERTIAARMGITVWDGANLLESVMKAFKVK